MALENFDVYFFNDPQPRRVQAQSFDEAEKVGLRFCPTSEVVRIDKKFNELSVEKVFKNKAAD